MHDGQRALSRRGFLAAQGLLLTTALLGCAADEPAGPEAGASGPRTLAEIRESGVLNVGISSDNAPLSFLNWKGIYDGIDQYFGLHMASTFRATTNFVSLDPYQRYDALLDGTVDVSLVQMSPEDERAGEVAFSAPLYALKLGIVSPADSVIEDPEQLTGGELVVCGDTYAQQYASSVLPDVALRTYGTLSEAYDALKGGHGIALIADEISIAAWMRKNPGFTLGVKGLGDRRLIAPAFVACDEDKQIVVDRAVSSFISYGYRSRSYTSDVKPLVGDAYTSIFDGISA